MPQERSPAEAIERLVATRAPKSDAEILDELRALPPLADESDDCWNDRNYWNEVAYLYVALADVAASRRLRSAIDLLLDRACFGDPGEIMRGLRHSLEAIVNPDWDALVQVCLRAARSSRRGTRMWALDELAILDDERARPLFEAALGDSAELQAIARRGLRRLDQRR